MIAAFDFFTVPTLTFRVLYCFFVIEHRRRRILHFITTAHRSGEWIGSAAVGGVSAEYVKRLAAGRCDLCGETAPFVTKDREPYLEIHHVQPLADGVADVTDNVVALCPNRLDECTF